MTVSDQNISELKNQYEDRLQRLDKDLIVLQNERDSLAAALQAAQQPKGCQK